MMDTIQEFHKNGTMKYNNGFLLHGGFSIIPDTRDSILSNPDEASGLTPEGEISLRQDLNQSTPIIGPVINMFYQIFMYLFLSIDASPIFF